MSSQRSVAKRASAFSLVLVSVLGIAACAAKPVVRPRTIALTAALNGASTVLLLEPQVRIDSPARNAMPFDPWEIDTHGLANAMTAAAKRAVPEARPCSAGEASDAQPCSLLTPHGALLSRGIVEGDCRAALENLSRTADRTVLVSSSVTGRTASLVGTNPYSGAITSDNSSTLLRAAAISCSSGEVVWKNEVLLREIPKPSDDSYAEALRLLFGGAGTEVGAP